jgi:hypothetical protein
VEDVEASMCTNTGILNTSKSEKMVRVVNQQNIIAHILLYAGELG